MTEKDFKRKLSAVMSADVAGYSRLMSQDEDFTVKTIMAYREVMTALIIQHRGRVVDSPGDNVLAEFGSVVDAVQCAVAIQKELLSRNESLPENRRMVFRIGINLGDVIEEEESIYGDGVNIAARLESLAEPGGICISKTAYELIETKLPLGYEYIGEQAVKNIPRPVGTYRVLMEPGTAGSKTTETDKGPGLWLRYVFFSVLAVLFVMAIAAVIWHGNRKPSSSDKHLDEKVAQPLPDVPSIAVLPFTNLSDDPDQEYFSDGMTDDLITDLSKISGLFVIARNSSFAYKGRSREISQVAEELGVQYILEGSIRKADDRVRINAQLSDATSGQQVWASRFDGHLENIFDLQDKVTQNIVAALAIKLTGNDQSLLTRKETQSIQAYDAYLRGLEHMRRHTKDDLVKAVDRFKKAISLDPGFAQGHAALSGAYSTMILRSWDKDLGWKDAQAKSEKHLQLAMEKPTALAHRMASRIHLYKRQYEQALSEAEQAVALDPNHPENHFRMAQVLIYTGRHDEAEGFIRKALRLDPHHPAYPLWYLGLAQFCQERFEDARVSIEKARSLNPELAAWPLATAYAHLGDTERARQVLNAYINKRGFENPHVKWLQPYYPFKKSEDVDRFAKGLEMAGLPLE